MMQTADSISHFFSNSPKRQLALGFIVRFRGKAEEMKGMCGTQWVVHHEVFVISAYILQLRSNYNWLQT